MSSPNEFPLENQLSNSQNANAVKTGLDLLTPPADIAKSLETIEFDLPNRSQNQRPILDFGEV